MHRSLSLLLLFMLLFVLPAESKVIRKKKPPRYDFSNAVIVTTDTLSASAKRVVQLFVEEVAGRTGIQLPVQHEWPDATHSCIAVGKLPEQLFLQGTYKLSLSEMAKPGSEGYRLRAIVGSRQVCWIVGADDRGIRYGIGQFLRSLHYETGALWLSHDLETTQTPASYLRGCRLTLPKTFDSNAIPAMKQYIRDLAVFGANCIAISVPGLDPNLAEAQNTTDYLSAVSQACTNNDLDLWVTCSDKILRTDSRRKQLAELLAVLPRVDAVFVDNYQFSSVSPDSLFSSINALAGRLIERHPSVKMWLNLPNAPKSAQLERFYSLMNTHPQWLGGVVYAPSQTGALPLETARRRIAAEIPMITFPDIAHNFNCQLPETRLDPAFALALGPRFINPRPAAMGEIHQENQALTNGSITASAGLFDDVNKFIWLVREWDPKMPVRQILHEYARFLINDSHADGIAMGLLALEKNWQTPLTVNSQIPITFQQWRLLAQSDPQAAAGNFRFQMGLLRAYADAALQIRLIHEMNVQHEAEAVLRRAPDIGAKKAIKKALHIFENQDQSAAVRDMETRCLEIVKTMKNQPGALFADSFDTFLAGMDYSLNDSRWAIEKLRSMNKSSSEPERMAAISEVLNRTNPGMGGYYVNAGTVFLTSGQLSGADIHYGAGSMSLKKVEPVPQAWLTQAVGTAEKPFELTFENLNPFLKYRIRVVYPTWCDSRVALTASTKFKIHPLRKFEQPVQEFSVPRRAISHGRVSFSWTSGRGEAGAQIAEVWLYPEEEPSIKNTDE